MFKGHSSNWKYWFPRLLVVKERADLLQLVKLFNFKILAKRGKYETTYSDAAEVNTKIGGKLVELSRHYSQLGYLWIWQTNGGLMSQSSTPGLICILHLSPFHCHPDVIREEGFDLPRFQSLHSWRKLDLILSAGGGANFLHIWQMVKRLQLQNRIITACFSHDLFALITSWCVKEKQYINTSRSQ